MERLEREAASAHSMRLWFCGLKDFSFLARFPRLRVLEVADWLAPDLRALRYTPELRGLRILHLPKVRDLMPLGQLRRLECLYLETLPSWDASQKANHFRSIKPLTRLTRLRKLGVECAEFGDGLKPLAKLRGLRWLGLSCRYPITEIAFLAGLMTRTQCASFEPYAIDESSFCKCRRCGASKALISASLGPRRPWWACPECNRGYLTEVTAEFERVKERAGRLYRASKRTR